MRSISQTPRISVLIPVFNTEKFISRCLDSILNQTFTDLEIVIVNDASQDASRQIIAQYEKYDERIVVIDKLDNEGLMAARRTGYLSATGKYCIFCDSDDYLPNNALELLYNAIDTSGLDLILAGYTYINTKGGSSFFSRDFMHDEKMSNNLHKSLLCREIPWSVCAAIYRRTLFEDFGYESFIHLTNLEDRILLIQLINNTEKIGSVADSVYFYCQNMESSSQVRLSSEKILRVLFAHNWCCNYLEKKNIYPDLARRDFLWVVLYFIESGYDKKNILDFCIQNDKPISFSEYHKLFGALYSIHAFFILQLKPYRMGCAIGRKIIRRIKLYIKCSHQG